MPPVCSPPSPFPPQPHSILQVPSALLTKLPHPSGSSESLLAREQWGVEVGVGIGSIPVMNSTGTVVQFHHSKNCSHGASNPMKTNKSKYLELVHEVFGFGSALMDSTSEYRDIYISLQTGFALLP